MEKNADTFAVFRTIVRVFTTLARPEAEILRNEEVLRLYDPAAAVMYRDMFELEKRFMEHVKARAESDRPAKP